MKDKIKNELQGDMLYGIYDSISDADVTVVDDSTLLVKLSDGSEFRVVTERIK